jgi:hypothetical protein
VTPILDLAQTLSSMSSFTRTAMTSRCFVSPSLLSPHETAHVQILSAASDPLEGKAHLRSLGTSEAFWTHLQVHPLPSMFKCRACPQSPWVLGPFVTPHTHGGRQLCILPPIQLLESSSCSVFSMDCDTASCANL